MEAIRATITGRVHGVGFRATTARVAAECDLAGWVRNRPDGSVEIWAQGEAAGLERFRAFLSVGPSFARVDEARLASVPPDRSLLDFSIRPTG